MKLSLNYLGVKSRYKCAVALLLWLVYGPRNSIFAIHVY